MKKILMLGTGGTIASRQTKDGLAPGLTPEDILSYIPAVKNVCEVKTKQVCNLDCTNVTPEHWKTDCPRGRGPFSTILTMRTGQKPSGNIGEALNRAT